MKQHFTYNVNLCMPITQEEIDRLTQVASMHYDYKCKQLPIDGCISTWQLHIKIGCKTVLVSISDADIVTKCCEMAYLHQFDDLYPKWRGILNSLIEEQRRSNASWMVEEVETYTQHHTDSYGYSKRSHHTTSRYN